METEIGNVYQTEVEGELKAILNELQINTGNEFLLNLVAGVGKTPCHRRMLMLEYIEEMICDNECGFSEEEERTIRDILTLISL